MRYVADSLKDYQDVNKHFLPFKYFLNPCSLDFDFIGKTETLTSDAPIVLKHLFDDKMELARENKSKSKRSAKEYYRNISKDLINKIYAAFEDDFMMYGYTYPKYLEK